MQRLVNRRELRALRKMRFWRRRVMDLSRPRLCVFRSSRHIQAQVFDDVSRRVIASASSIEAGLKGSGLRGKDLASKVGSIVAERALKAGVKTVTFDRNGFMYHGRVQKLAEAARETGLEF